MTGANPAAPLIVLTAGGTGGHVFPAEALAAALLQRGLRLGLITDSRGHSYGGTLGSLTTWRVRAGGLAGRGLTARIGAVLDLGIGCLQARRLIARLRPAVVVGFGGYASVPAMLAASRLGIPTILHEQNAVLGRANRLLAPRVKQIATCYSELQQFSPAWKHKAVLTGMPVRPAVSALRGTPYAAVTSDGPVRLLVLGGSQGARVLSEVIPAALERLPEALRQRIDLSQQCRPEDLEMVRAAYARSGVNAVLESFFQDVPERMAAAHLVIARAGASTVGELTNLGRPAILVPYPHAIDDHQTANAHAVDDAGGGWLIPQPSFTPDSLAQRLESLVSLPGSLTRAAACAQTAGLPDAAERLADLVLAQLSPVREKV